MLALDDNEKLVAVFRKHNFHFLAQIGGVILAALIPLFVYVFVGAFVPQGLTPASGYFLWFVYFLYLAVLWHISFILWTDYYLDTWILTDKRLIDVEQKGLFSRDVSSLRLDRIQDIKLEVSGVLHTFIDMGTIYVQTAGNEREFVIRNAKHPEQVKELILSEHNKKMEEVKTVHIANPAV